MKNHVFLVHEVKVAIATNNNDFGHFVQSTLQNYRIEASQDHRFQIEVFIDFEEELQIRKSTSKIGNGVFLNETDQSIMVQHKLFMGEFLKKSETVLSIRGEVRNDLKSRLKHFLKRMAIKNYSYKEMLFHQLYRELILMPTFWILRNKFEKYLMHASAVSNGKSTYVFLGNDGVGKTTVALQLLKDEKSSFFGDNFLLYDSNKIYPFVDTLRVSKGDKKEIRFYESSPLFQKVYEGKERVHFNFSRNRVSACHAPTHFFVLKQATKNNEKIIAQNHFINYTFAINNYVKEFDKYSYAGNLVFLYATDANIERQENESLARLISNKKCALLGVNKREDILSLFN
ncbi:MAG: hypothetical protein AAF554_14195 [Bacteroidota bacterium]